MVGHLQTAEMAQAEDGRNARCPGMAHDARLARDVSRKLVYDLFRYIIPVPRRICGRVLVGGIVLVVAGF